MHRLDDRAADVAGRHAAQPGRAQDRVEHLDGRGLAVGAGDREPGRGRGRVAQPPGQLDLAPDRDAALRRLHEQRCARPPAGRDHDRSASSGSASVEPGRAGRRRRGPRAARPSPRGRSARSSSATTGAPRWVRLSAAAKPAHPEPGHDRPDAGPVVAATEPVDDRASGVVVTRRHPGGVEDAEAGGDAQAGDDPEADHDRDLVPAEQLEVVLQRRHPEHPVAGLDPELVARACARP